MSVNLVSNADVRCIAIVDKGANRKRFFLTKTEGEEVTPLPSAERIVKASDWSAVYCVVAEPDALENPGMGAEEPLTDDRWASEDEIRKAAHKFMANGGLVTKMHESLEPYGQLVENAVALADFEVDGETIRKGSWYIAIEPTDEGKEAIEKGEFTGVSIEGMAVRELVEKSTSAGSTSPDRTVKAVENETVPKGFLRKLAVAVGLSKEDIAELEEVEKANLTFGAIVTQREFEDALPEAFSAFRESVWRAFFPEQEESFDPVAHLSQSCDEFKDWCLSMLDKVPVAKAERAGALGVEVTPDGSIEETRKKDGDMPLTDAENERITKLEAAVEALPTAMAALAKAVGAPVADDAPPTAESVAKALNELPAPTDPEYADRLAKVEADIKKLGEGNTSQTETDEEPVTKQDAEAIRKAYTDQGVNPALAGVLG